MNGLERKSDVQAAAGSGPVWRRDARTTPTGPAVIEPLEERLHLNGAFTVKDGLLKVYGNRRGSNRILVALDRRLTTVTITLDGQTIHLRQHSVRKVQIFGGHDSDFLAIDQRKHDWINDVTIVGGGGDDTIIGGDGSNQLFATGTGNALLIAGNGDSKDVSGADSVDSTLIGGTGNDTLQGGTSGNDILIAGNGDQLLTGSLTGYNVIFGGLGNDTLVGGAGQNDLLGYIGNNVLRGTGGQDTIYAGQGTESIHSEPNAEVHHGVYPAFIKFRADLLVNPPL